ncbi:MAG: (d)CMP kinase [Nocardioidaceae bacterium]
MGVRDVVVAIDGPSGSGKSSTARRVAARLGLRYLDTGAMYRALTWWMLQHEIDVTDPERVAAHADEPALACGTDPAGPTISVDGVDVAAAIRTQPVTSAVSAVSAVPDVRARLKADQRDLIGAGGIVVEGRDIGTVVAPDAQVKIFLTAAPDARASRRSAELAGASLAATRADLARRDAADSERVASPLRMADDATPVDTTAHTLDEVVEIVISLVEQEG